MRDESSQYERKRKEEKDEKVEPKVEMCVFLASSAKSFLPYLTLLPLKLLPTTPPKRHGKFAFGILDTKRKSSQLTNFARDKKQGRKKRSKGDRQKERNKKGKKKW